MNKKNETIDIILPSRIGDCILSFPALLCLKQLIERQSDKNLKIRLFSTNKLTEIIDKLNLFEVKQYNNFAKIKSFINPSNKAIFLEPSMRNLGFFAKKTYGIEISQKKLKYSVNMPYLHTEQAPKYIEEKLLNFLADKYKFSICSIIYFRMLLELDFSSEDIIDTFDFTDDSLNFEIKNTKKEQNIKNYMVFCMEAAYGGKHDADRRFNEEKYFEIAKEIYDKFGFNSAFIGIDDCIKLPAVDYIIDFRKKLDFLELAQLMKSSKGYIGNDTGPLHLANLMKSPSLGIYARENTIKNYGPIFSNLNTVSLNIPSLDEVNNFCSKLY